MKMHTLAAFAASALALATAGGAAAAPITLKVADSLPSGHIAHQYILRPFMEAVTRRTHGEITFQHFPGEQLGKAKDMLIMAQSGVADIAFTTPAYVSDKMPLTGAAELPGAFRNVCEAVKAYRTLTREGGILAKYEFGANRVRPLMSFPIAPAGIAFSTTRKLETVAELKGAKIRTSGGAQDVTVENLGAVSVRMSPPEVYTAMQRGTVDGALYPIPALISYDLTRLVKSFATNVNFGGIMLTYAIGETRWNKLTAEQKTIMEEEGDRAVLSGCEKLDAELDDDVKKIQASGAHLFEYAPGDVSALDTIFDKVRKDWAADLDRRGKRGTETLEAWTAAVKAVRAGGS